jgi:hypothetical protein
VTPRSCSARSLLLASAVVGALVVPAVAGGDPYTHGKTGQTTAERHAAATASAERRTNDRSKRSATGAVARHFRVLGHSDLGAVDTNGDVWAHGNFAYVGTWAVPCTGRGVKIVDVSNLRRPRMIGTLAARPGTSAEDMVVRRVSTPFFTGDLIAVGIQRCGDDPALDEQQFGLELWDVTDPYRPRRLGELPMANGGGGVHELDLFQRGGKVYALLAVPFREWFDPVPAGDFAIADVTNPRMPVEVASWGAGAHGLAPGPFFGQGSFGASYDHSARASADGTKAYVSYWDLGVLTFDITDVANPILLSRTRFAADADGDAHSVVPYQARRRSLLLQNDEDLDPRSPLHIRYGSTVGIGNESPFAPALWLEPGHAVSGRVVEAANQGCAVADYPSGTTGAIAVVRSPFGLVAPPPEERLCDQAAQERAAEAAGATAVVHDFISTDTSPQWWDPAEDVGIPVAFTDHATARGMVSAGAATLVAQTPSWGFLRVFDAATGRQVAQFDDLPGVHALPAPEGTWTIHNTEVLRKRAYSSWYSNGVVALDLRPLDRPRPADPRLVGQFVPPAAAPAPGAEFLGEVPQVWGVAVRARDRRGHGNRPVIFASDMNSGLWIVEATGVARNP